jgi:uncharacterized protein YgiM (DUF1202 family)
MRVTAPQLNVRNGPGTSFDVVGTLHAGDVVTIDNVASRDVWGQFQTGQWAAIAFRADRYLEFA